MMGWLNSMKVAIQKYRDATSHPRGVDDPRWSAPFANWLFRASRMYRIAASVLDIIATMNHESPRADVTISQDAAVAAISASRVEASLALGRTSIGVVDVTADLCRSISGIRMASFNAVFRLRSAPDPDRQIDGVIRYFASRTMPFIWWVKDTEGDLDTHLSNHGLDYYGEESAGMAIALTHTSRFGDNETPASVQRVNDAPALRTWFSTLLGSFETIPSEDTLEVATSIFAQLAADTASGWHFYLARIEGRPVGTCALHLGTAAGLYSVGTLPSVRRLGVGTALSVAALDDARLAGYRMATLTASEVGAHLYDAIGFKEYCRYREFVWRPELSSR
jgi:GNAT superfamily N-acetyltransferase